MTGDAPGRLFVHIDMDSPETLRRFWGLESGKFDYDQFFRRCFPRILDFFSAERIPVTFFCIGEEMDAHSGVRDGLAQAWKAGHELANHTYTHPAVLTQLTREQIGEQIDQCSASISRITGSRPAGFRAPGYQINETVLEILEDRGFLYDSSAFWSILHPLAAWYHRIRRRSKGPKAFQGTSPKIPREPYFPDRQFWQKRGEQRALLEIPMPRTRFLQLPFYNNFHLMTPAIYRRSAAARQTGSALVYLCHLIEFTDLTDGIPAPLKIHPNLRRSAKSKIESLRDSLRILKRRFQPALTADYAQNALQHGLAHV